MRDGPERSAPSHRASQIGTEGWTIRENETPPERVAIARYRELPGDEARDLSDEDVEAIRRAGVKAARRRV